MNIFVTRHQGARDWAKAQELLIDSFVSHLDPETVNEGDVVIGTLPIHVAADIQERGARYMYLSMTMPYELRGTDLTAEQMDECSATLEEYEVKRVVRGSRPYSPKD